MAIPSMSRKDALWSYVDISILFYLVREESCMAKSMKLGLKEIGVDLAEN